MPDLSDVEVALTAATLAALYPSGIDQPSSVGYPVRVFRGEPITATLERDMVANVANVGVFSVADSTRVTTRWLPASLTTAGAPTLMAETEGLTVGYSGLGGIGQVAGIIVDEQAFVYRATGADTPALVAAMLAAAIGKVRPCLLSGATLTIPGAYRVIGRVVADGSSNSELSRQEQSFCIANWCPNPQVRDIVDFHAELTRVFHRELTPVNLWFAVHAEVKFLPFSFRPFEAAALALKRKLSLPVSTMWQ